jgi:hypothetical protein
MDLEERWAHKFSVFLRCHLGSYDTLSHSAVAMSLACHLYGIPREAEDMLLATISGYERFIYTAYQLGDNDTNAEGLPKGLLAVRSCTSSPMAQQQNLVYERSILT